MHLPLAEGAIEIPVPERFKNLIPSNYCIEASELQDGQIQLSIIKIKMKSVTCKFDTAEMLLSDEQLKDRILTPMLTALIKVNFNV